MLEHLYFCTVWLWVKFKSISKLILKRDLKWLLNKRKIKEKKKNLNLGYSGAQLFPFCAAQRSPLLSRPALHFSSSAQFASGRPKRAAAQQRVSFLLFLCQPDPTGQSLSPSSTLSRVRAGHEPDADPAPIPSFSGFYALYAQPTPPARPWSPPRLPFSPKRMGAASICPALPI